MVHIPFDPRTIGYDDHHTTISQIGGGTDENYYYFRGLNPYQRGYGRQMGGGVGDVLRNFWRFLLPYAKRAGTAVAKEALDTGGRILESVGNPEYGKEDSNPNFKQTVINEGKRGLDRLLEKGGMTKQFGTGLQARDSIKGLKRKRKPHSSFSKEKSHQIIIGKPSHSSKKKRQKIDTFGLY
uniref:Uncharacterized protein n=1 Tax=Meloidogyne enterolobii TaxID=390850 RepID=A0A6V7WS68_MELEN|nr:unnamed protein product [Meloidogyne enterolobii]CAD2178529.1 unnamed protein product [Meloidogyne enterolobii]CAD2178849.1 unnamed protein product [Meloidogyne enterolobii]CAD2189646.1 unnamed protein product [Meloidogyne enterolobii]CAD2191000.1 unnamed protein product [Meloidogyne enterolobii]